jgi:hypothetical protein
MVDKDEVPGKPHSQSVQLHSDGLKAGHLVEQAFKHLSPEQTQALMSKAADEALRLEVETRARHIDYVEGKKALEDHVDAFNMLDKGGTFTRNTLKSDIKTGAGRMTVESKSGAGCFVATAVYGGLHHPDVEFLRQFRDRKLRGHPLGDGFISWYLSAGPKMARFLSDKPKARSLVRACLRLFVGILRKAG